MGHEGNDLQQLKQVRQILTNVYKTQASGGVVPADKLSNIHNALLQLMPVITWLETQPPHGE